MDPRLIKLALPCQDVLDHLSGDGPGNRELNPYPHAS